ncbi:MarR family winged helix-turn-helix transcriptional regulator [Bacillus niameyensis]|uniref:MarR family winged helix-turn-helix transcriptional regulator n=1 Tax=Bacillus niameyensis TaxID=1522308 RepID=UPI00078122CE|nr:MarR family transcriptional regulator [Bacillus niameyensis]
MTIDDRLQQHDEDVVAGLERHLRYISGIIKQKGRVILTDFSITPPQFIALQWLSESGDMTIGELSNKMFLACSTTTDLIDRMEKKELVMRVRDPNDRRVVRIHLLEKGKKIIGEVIRQRRAYLNDVLTGFSPDEVIKLSGHLAKLHQDMKKN